MIENKNVNDFEMDQRMFGGRLMCPPADGIRTRNLNYDHTGVSKPNCPEYLERYFDTEENVWKTWNGSEWL